MTQPRSPIVAILGHVDHGKTTLLDFIRKTSLTEKEHGGITQSIGAYEISTGLKGYSTDKITFIDTPGHEAFTKLRARGATVADVALLIIDAKDSLKPQTIESISHIKAANIPYIVVLNKIDLPEARPDKVKNDLLKYEVMVEGKGGSVPLAEISAKTGKGVPELLESILLLASDQQLTFDIDTDPEAYIIETKKDRRGSIISAIIKNGVLKKGLTIYADSKKAVIRSLTNDKGQQVETVQPSTPFELLGFSELPEVGSVISTKDLIAHAKAAPFEKRSIKMEDLFVKEEGRKLSVVLKTDNQGSLEAIKQSVAENKNLVLVLAAIGDITKSDIFLAKATKSILIGFNIKPSNEVKDLSKQEKITIKLYNIIYELLEELHEVADLIKEKEEIEKSIKGEAKVLASFVIESEKVFGVRINKGKANMGDTVMLYRDNKPVAKTILSSLRIHAKTVEEVKKDQEAGMLFDPAIDIRVGDVIKFIL
ncbi:MAG: translation initiation factor IF-2 [Microgenomates group bacterium]|jgi:translation initiation factor IF-2|nr:GTP-binding protein [Candidatus Woesebacteria bacterium]QQR63622.1 MAG: GTP-binding protein [Candidatus Roizmanbacteria bacterium]